MTDEIERLTAEIERLTAERDEYRRALRYLVGNEWEESAGDTLSEKAMSTVIDRQAAQLAALRAVVEEAREYLNRAIRSETYKEYNDCVLVAQDILDRGLKGAGDE